MKRLAFILLSVIVLSATAFAIRASRDVVTFKQPDGSLVDVVQHGDEHFHFRTTTDNLMVLSDSLGYLRYAVVDKISGNLIPSLQKATRINDRENDELIFIQQLSANTIENAVRMQAKRNKIAFVDNTVKYAPAYTNETDTTHFLVILAQYSDVSFTLPNAKQQFDDQFNSPDYTTGGATGSVRQYFHDNSLGKFEPRFDVVGPYTLSGTRKYYGENKSDGYDIRPRELVFEACQLANADVDFSKYDQDGDGKVDKVYVIFASYAESSTGGKLPDANWPMAWQVNNTTQLDGKRISDYSMSQELYGNSGTTIDGIGSACHEFSHKLGLLDVYDVDYSTNGESYDIEYWSLMSMGNYLNNSRTPTYYTSFERMMVGWGNPIELTEPDSLTLQSIATNQFYKISTKTSGEYFLLENRQKTGWDSFIRGNGMLIYHIDNTDAVAAKWRDNELNTHTNHNCVDIEEADGIGSLATIAGDPFPGTANVTSFTDTTIPSSKAWSDAPTEKPITNIREENGLIKFDFMGGASPFSKIIASPATDVTSNSFTANWSASTNATNYLLSVYTKSDTGLSANYSEAAFNELPNATPVGWTMTSAQYGSTTGYFGAASPSSKMTVTGDYTMSPILSDVINELSFWYRGSTVAAGTLKVEVSSDKLTWDTVRVFTSFPTKGTVETYPIDRSKNYRVVRFSYTKNIGNAYIDDVKIGYGDKTKYNFALENTCVGNVLSYSVTGLNENELYYYTVKATNANDTSLVSNEIAVHLGTQTNLTLPVNNNSRFKITPVKNGILIAVSESTTVDVYNLYGQQIISQIITGDHQFIALAPCQLYVIKMNNVLYKVLIK